MIGEPPPPWAPVMLQWLGTIEGRISLPRVVTESVEDLAELTRAACPRPVLKSGVPMGDSAVFEQAVVDFVSRLSSRANDLLQLVLPDPPELQCVLTLPENWFDDEAITWGAVDHPSGTLVRIETLSRAERRWAA